MPIVIVVEEVDHAGQAGRLAGAGGAGDEEQAAGADDEALDRLGHPHVLELEELRGNLPHHDAEVAALAEDGHAKADAVRVGDREVGAAFLLNLGLAPVGRDALHQGRGVVWSQDAGLELTEPPLVAERRFLADRDVQVVRPDPDGRFKQLLDQNFAVGHFEDPCQNDRGRRGGVQPWTDGRSFAVIIRGLTTGSKRFHAIAEQLRTTLLAANAGIRQLRGTDNAVS